MARKASPRTLDEIVADAEERDLRIRTAGRPTSPHEAVFPPDGSSSDQMPTSDAVAPFSGPAAASGPIPKPRLVRVCTTIPVDLQLRFKLRAVMRGVSMSSVLADAIRDFVEEGE